MDPQPITDLVGIVLLLAAVAWHYFGAKKAAAASV
jgi:hypothetical protein